MSKYKRFVLDLHISFLSHRRLCTARWFINQTYFPLKIATQTKSLIRYIFELRLPYSSLK